MKFFLLGTVILILLVGFVGAYSTLYIINEKLTAQVAEILPELPKLDQIKGVYLTAGTALSSHINQIIDLVKTSELNSLVIDVQTDKSFYLNSDMRKLVRRLRFAGIYPIARIAVFQHNGTALAHPEWAIKTADGQLWKDSGGRYWLDAASQPYWQEILGRARQAASMGFGEINLDYIRFPSDGQLSKTTYPFWDKKISRTKIITAFAKFIKDNLKKDYPQVQVTADLFGYLLLRDNDLGIGQSVTDLASIFDVICPMVYPSHYDPGNFNFDNPADHPYEVVYQSLALGKKIFDKHQKSFTNIRPWIQDFNLGAFYTPEMVRVQMKAITDANLNKGWLVWNPNNKYRSAIFQTK